MNQRLVPANSGDLVESIVRDLYDTGLREVGRMNRVIQLNSAVFAYPDLYPVYPSRHDRDWILGSLNLTEPITCEK